ncbi:hypothetical protein [Xenorhabdus bharatensis]|uniref:hypothetical protein n=1 Tax=Xenorhabdus bharatensis TaxID=3136256 RepID=UPI0030F39112
MSSDELHKTIENLMYNAFVNRKCVNPDFTMESVNSLLKKSGNRELSDAEMQNELKKNKNLTMSISNVTGKISLVTLKEAEEHVYPNNSISSEDFL